MEHVAVPSNSAGQPFFFFLFGIIFAALICASVGLAFPGDAIAVVEVAGKLSIVEGGVTIKRPGLDRPLNVKAGAELLVGDVLVVGDNGWAQLVLTDSAFVNIAQGASLRVNQYSLSPDTRLPGINRRTTVVKVMRGKARFIVYKQMSQDSAITVETEHALVTAQGTVDFVVNVMPDRTEALALTNQVSVKNASYLVVGVVNLTENLLTAVKAQTPPSKPAVMTPQIKNAYIKEVRQIR